MGGGVDQMTTMSNLNQSCIDSELGLGFDKNAGMKIMQFPFSKVNRVFLFWRKMSHAIGRLGESFLLPNQICAVLSPLILQRIIVGDASYQQVDSRVR